MTGCAPRADLRMMARMISFGSEHPDSAARSPRFPSSGAKPLPERLGGQGRARPRCRCRRPAPTRQGCWCGYRRKRSSAPAASGSSSGTDHVDDPPMAALDVVQREGESSAAVVAHRFQLPRQGSRMSSWLSVGTRITLVANVVSGRRTQRPASRSPSKACGLVTSCTRWRSIYNSVASSVALTTWRFQTFSNNVSGISNRPREDLVAQKPQPNLVRFTLRAADRSY